MMMMQTAAAVFLRALDIFLLVVGQLAGKGGVELALRLGLKVDSGVEMALQEFPGEPLGLSLEQGRNWKEAGLNWRRSWSSRYSEKALVDHWESSEAARPFRTVWSREGLSLHMAGVARALDAGCPGGRA